MLVKTSKVAKLKRNNQKKNKLVKHGLIKKKNIKKCLSSVPVPKNKKNVEISEGSDIGEDILQMVDEDDMTFLKQSIKNRSYNLLNNIRYSSLSISKSRKRKIDEDDFLENEYEAHMMDNINRHKTKNLLPIKTKTGIIPQQVTQETEDIWRDKAIETTDNDDVESKSEEEQLNDNGDYVLANSGMDVSKPISATQLLTVRNEMLRQKKIHIGTLSSGLLENPEEKIMNLKSLLIIMDDETPEVFLTVRKLVIISLLEVFKDILPSYEIKHINSEGLKLKKDTLKLKKFEENLLLYYKFFLQKLEKYGFKLIRRKGDSRKKTNEETVLSILSIQAMCELLVTHPYFNYSQNIAQAVALFLNSHNKTVRETVKTSIKQVIKEDKREEITLKLLRIINNYLKNHTHVYPDMLEVLLVLNLKDVNLDQEKEQDIKEKKLLTQKSKILQMSKKERKRKKKLKEVEKELLETKAEENKQAKHKHLTEITKIVFNIYFRILKNSNNTKVLGVCLEGLAKFAHCINLDFYVDLVNVFDNLLKEEWLGYKEQLHCIQTVFAILSGQGEALHLDPTRFYISLYKDLLTIDASSKKSDNFLILLKTLNDALIKRRKKITKKRTISFVKRLTTLSLQLLHDGSLGCLGIIRNILQLNRYVDVLLDFDMSVGEGNFQAEIDDPEYANASSTALYEVTLLAKHYHPIVNKYARNIANVAVSTGEGSLHGEYAKWSAEQLYTEFNMSEMVFNPPVPIPTKLQPKSRTKVNQFQDSTFEHECKQILTQFRKRRKGFVI